MNYYERHIGDYLKDTAHLSLLEHGVYSRLIDVYYTREGAIPVAQVERLVGARSKEEREALAAVLDEFFTVQGDSLLHKRCEREIERFKEKQDKARRSANARWSSVAEESERNANAMRTHSEGNALQTPDTRHQEEKQPTVVVKRSASDPSRYSVPDCPYERLLDVYHEALPMLPRVVVVSNSRKVSIRSRWVEVCASEKFDTDAGVQWFRDFLWGVRKSKFLTGNCSPSPGRAPFKADLEWLMKPSNFAKVVEGRYHGETA